MLILLGLLVFVALFIVAGCLFSDDGIKAAFWTSVVVVVFIFLIFLAAIPINRINTKASIARFNATASTLEMARKQGNVLENAALQQKVLEQNQWLSEAKYYKLSVWGLWVSADVNNLSPIK